MDKLEHKALELARQHNNRCCATCRNKRGEMCEVVADRNNCIYNDMELWQPDKSAFIELAERVLERG